MTMPETPASKKTHFANRIRATPAFLIASPIHSDLNLSYQRVHDTVGKWRTTDHTDSTDKEYPSHFIFYQCDPCNLWFIYAVCKPYRASPNRHFTKALLLRHPPSP